MTDLVNAFMGVFDPVSFALITGGTIFGIIFGAIPGLTATLAVILLIPLSYGLEPTQGISMLVGVYIGGISGGVVAAVLLGMPGTPSSMVTVLDGFALAKQGRAGKALGAGVPANLAGSFIGWPRRWRGSRWNSGPSKTRRSCCSGSRRSSAFPAAPSPKGSA